MLRHRPINAFEQITRVSRRNRQLLFLRGSDALDLPSSRSRRIGCDEPEPSENARAVRCRRSRLGHEAYQRHLEDMPDGSGLDVEMPDRRLGAVRSTPGATRVAPTTVAVVTCQYQRSFWHQHPRMLEKTLKLIRSAPAPIGSSLGLRQSARPPPTPPTSRPRCHSGGEAAAASAARARLIDALALPHVWLRRRPPTRHVRSSLRQ